VVIQKVRVEELKPMKKYLAITDEENLKIILSKSIFGVTDRHLKNIHKLKKDDQIIFYLKPKRIVAVFKVADSKISNYIKWGEYIHQIRLEPKIIKNPVSLNTQFIDQLSYFRNKLWGPTLMGKAILELPDSDWDKLQDLLREK